MIARVLQQNRAFRAARAVGHNRLSSKGTTMFRHALLLASLLWSLSCTPAEPTAPTASGANSKPESEQAVLYVFNDSGWTLIPSDQAVTDNGKEIARLPRKTYVQLALAPGPHVLKPEPPLWKQEVQLSAEAGHRYYVVIAYKPERSWLIPLAGTPLVLKEISDEQGAQLLRELKPK